MKLIKNAQGQYILEASAFEVFVCHAALREVLYGFHFPDFKPRMGCTREEARAVLEALPVPLNEDVDGTSSASGFGH